MKKRQVNRDREMKGDTLILMRTVVGVAKVLQEKQIMLEHEHACM